VWQNAYRHDEARGTPFIPGICSVASSSTM